MILREFVENDGRSTYVHYDHLFLHFLNQQVQISIEHFHTMESKLFQSNPLLFFYSFITVKINVDCLFPEVIKVNSLGFK